jgi:hypothetical protein
MGLITAGQPPVWQLLGNITNAKPSAIFRSGSVRKFPMVVYYNEEHYDLEAKNYN